LFFPCFFLIPRPPRSPLFPYTTLFRSARHDGGCVGTDLVLLWRRYAAGADADHPQELWRSDPQRSDCQCNGARFAAAGEERGGQDRKSTRLNSSHVAISYAVFCLKKKT